MITNFNNFMNESFKDLFKNKEKIRYEKYHILMATIQEAGAFSGGLSDVQIPLFINELIDFVEEYGYGDKNIANFSDFIDKKISNTSSRVQDFWMDVSDYYGKNKNKFE